VTIRTITIDPEDGRIALSDYDTLVPWWRKRGGQAPPRAVLPTLGVIAEQAGVPVASAFAYLDATGSGVAIISWHITSPDAHPRSAGRGLKKCLDFLELETRRLGYWLIWTTTSNASLASYLQVTGYKKGEEGMTHLFKALPTLQSPQA
jgi:hypothetical protein